MFRAAFGLAPKLESDGSYSPSRMSLKLAAPSMTDYEEISYPALQGKRIKVAVIFTEQKNMTMKNGKAFSTGNHPVEAILPMLHLKTAGFEFEILTPTGKPVVFEMWAMPRDDKNVMSFYEEYKSQFENPKSLQDFVANSLSDSESYAAVFVPGGHGAMLGLPEDKNLGTLLHWAHENGLFTVTLCHGPGSLLASKLDGKDFIYSGYKMAVFPDSVDKQTPLIGYLPGHMPWKLNEQLTNLGAVIVNKKADNATCVDRNLITGASPLAANELGKLATNTILRQMN